VAAEAPGEEPDHGRPDELDRQDEPAEVCHERIQLDAMMGEREGEPVRDLAHDKKPDQRHRSPNHG
jgi:hypothetical protein